MVPLQTSAGILSRETISSAHLTQRLNIAIDVDSELDNYIMIVTHL